MHLVMSLSFDNNMEKEKNYVNIQCSTIWREIFSRQHLGQYCPSLLLNCIQRSFLTIPYKENIEGNKWDFLVCPSLTVLDRTILYVICHKQPFITKTLARGQLVILRLYFIYIKKVLSWKTKLLTSEKKLMMKLNRFFFCLSNISMMVLRWKFVILGKLIGNCRYMFISLCV